MYSKGRYQLGFSSCADLPSCYVTRIRHRCSLLILQPKYKWARHTETAQQAKAVVVGFAFHQRAPRPRSQ